MTDLRSAYRAYRLSAEYIAYYIYGCIDGARVIPKKVRTLLRRVFIFGNYSKGYNGSWFSNKRKGGRWEVGWP